MIKASPFRVNFSPVASASRPARARSLILNAAAALSLTALSTLSAAALPDPFGSNNGFLPVDPKSGELLWKGPFRTLNFDYPETAPPSAWLKQVPRKALTVATAPAYAQALKKFVEPHMRDMIEKPNEWNPKKVGWYDMPWQAQGQDATQGREAILGSFAGQTLPSGTFANINIPLQNHTVIYYDALSATMLRKLWANPFNPDRTVVSFPEGAMVVKAGAVTTTPEQWPVIKDAAQWHVWRPPVPVSRAPTGPAPAKTSDSAPAPQILPLRLMQFDIIVKDSVAAPRTGWVFTTFVYNVDAPGRSPWEKLVPLGAMWGNDPEVAKHETSKGLTNKPHKDKPLKETWINDAAPAYSKEQIGWGGRLSGPIDISKRHNVIFTGGGKASTEQRASSCFSCHGTAQYPFIANLYPSPNLSFPPDGTAFLLYTPGSPEWNRWFQSRSGKTPQNKGRGAVALDYDMLIMLALDTFDRTSGSDLYLQGRRVKGH